MSAFVMISCEEEYDVSIEGILRDIPEIKEIQHTTGRYDVIVKIESPSTESLREIISLKIRKISKVRSTTTLISSPILVF
ncbi:Transcriptional regulator, AsnC family [Nitrosotalea devaniterrae]|uniref:Transcriptional regulator, AsnC family n=1 Tax=Nitrosotalea devaniterrae TaxID=1078905 RepID=A0A128A439_9ARCH|nr:Transcriptional regulator, AsnC family [Candidatus Nitrosotalea devanaterra]